MLPSHFFYFCKVFFHEIWYDKIQCTAVTGQIEKRISDSGEKV